MAIDPATLLPPNATALEGAMAKTLARISDVPVPLADLWNPATCPLPLLPWLAWALSIDHWKAGWSEAQKRLEVARAIEQQRRKGTPASLDALLASFDELITFREWFEQYPLAEPHTFEVTLPLGGAGGVRSTAAFAAEVVRDIYRIKPVRSHFTFVQQLDAAAGFSLRAAGQAFRFERRAAAVLPIPGPWDNYLQTETGEPLQAPDGSYLEES